MLLRCRLGTAQRRTGLSGDAVCSSRRLRTRALVIVTVVVATFGGATIDRAVVASPAWQRLGPAAWAAYSRHADLGNGRIVYAIYGIGLAAFAIAAAISYRFDRHAPRRAGIPIYLSALAAIGVIADHHQGRTDHARSS